MASEKNLFTLRYLRANGQNSKQLFSPPFVVSGSTWLTALSTSKGYRTMNGKQFWNSFRKR